MQSRESLSVGEEMVAWVVYVEFMATQPVGYSLTALAVKVPPCPKSVAELAPLFYEDVASDRIDRRLGTGAVPTGR